MRCDQQVPLVPASPRHPKRCLGHPVILDLCCNMSGRGLRESYATSKYQNSEWKLLSKSGVDEFFVHVSDSHSNLVPKLLPGNDYPRSSALQRHPKLTLQPVRHDLNQVRLAGWHRRYFERLKCSVTICYVGHLRLSIPLVPSSPRHPKPCLGHPTFAQSPIREPSHTPTGHPQSLMTLPHRRMPR